MQPNQQGPNYSPDYLNQIAPRPTRKIPFTKFQIFLGVAAILIIAVVILSVSLSSGGNSLERLSARLIATEEIVTKSQENLKDSELRSLNSSLEIYLTNANLDYEPLLKQAGIGNINKSTLEKESNKSVLDSLEEARLNATFDRNYAREISYNLEVTITLMYQIYESSTSSSIKEFLTTNLANLVPTQESFSSFQAST